MSFVRSVCAAMERIAPLRLAESWDNVGLLLESPPVHSNKKILLTIDLTPTVATEAIASRTSLIISYHPPIFRPLSSLTLNNPIQRSLLRLAQAGISVYSPHTALDSVQGGINDWLGRAFLTGDREPSESMVPEIRYLKDRDDERGGAGRLLLFPQPGLPIVDIVERVKRHLGLKGQVHLSTPYDNARNVRTIAVCAGSGGSMFQDVDADLYFTGEMQHHDVLAARAMDRYVLLCGHTNTERGYLPVLKESLLAQQEVDPTLSDLDIRISQADEHPLVGL